MLLPAAAAGLLLATQASSVPQQLQVNYQRSSALGVGPLLRFSWQAPASTATAAATLLPAAHEGAQSSYSIVISETTGGASSTAWSSGVVRSAASINVALDARKAGLHPGQAYNWTVACNGGPASDPATFITALWDGFDPAARWIWASDIAASQHYASLRCDVAAAVGVGGQAIERALLFVTAWQEPTMLASYKFYVDGALVSLGPGRGEADVMSGNSTFLRAPYSTVDVTPSLRRDSVLAVEAMAPLFAAPCDLHACKDPNTNGGGVLAQLNLRFSDGSNATIFTSGGSAGGAWHAAPADGYRNPTPPSVQLPFLSGETAYAKVMENIDAREAPATDWKTAAASPEAFKLAVVSFYQQREQLVAKMARPLQVNTTVAAPPLLQNRSHPSSYFADFGREMQGGVVLTVEEGAPAEAAAHAGTVIRFIGGELLLPNGTTDATTQSRLDPKHTWGYSFNWTLRAGPQVIEQHDYMIFRYLAIEVLSGVLPSNFSISAWRVNYEYEESDSSFASSDAMLNQVHELARWTLEAGVVDTLTDSNARERRPYECDGLIGGTNRALVQGDQMLNRHSYSWTLEVPTWPVEWMQMSALMGWQDYWATGSTDLFETFEARMHERTQIALVDATGLVNTSHGRHLYSWDPPSTKAMFVNSDHASVCNSFAVKGLESLAAMAAAAGRAANASVYGRQAAAMKAAFLKELGDPTAQHFCDGPCADAIVDHHSGVTTNYFTMYHGLVPDAWVPNVWRELAEWGLVQIGDFGSFVYLNALSMYAGDDGSAMLTALTKCDTWSWCFEIQTFNASMTRESLDGLRANGQTMSHSWGTGALSGIIHGIVGVQQTAAAWRTFTVKPLLANLGAPPCRDASPSSLSGAVLSANSTPNMP
jgi:hypothetical protein